MFLFVINIHWRINTEWCNVNHLSSRQTSSLHYAWSVALTASWDVLLPDCWGFPGSWAQQHWAPYPLMHRTDAGMSCMEHKTNKQLCDEMINVSTGGGGLKRWWIEWGKSKQLWLKTVLPAWLVNVGSSPQNVVHEVKMQHFKKLHFNSNVK